MTLKTLLAFFSKGAFTLISLSILASVSFPSEVFSITTQLENKPETNSSSSQLKEKQESNLVIAKKYKDKDRDRDRDRDRDDDDDDDDDDDKRNYHRRREYRREENRSAKYFRKNDWSTYLKCGRLVNSRQRALVVQMDILEKPVTRYANAVYTVYARRANRWVQIYNNQGARLIEKQSGRFILQPEIIEFNQLQSRNIDLSNTELKVVAQIRYDLANRRDQTVVFENIWNSREITEVRSISELTNISYSNTSFTENVNSSTFNNTNTSTTGTTVATSTNNQSITLVNGFRINYLGVTYKGNTSTWSYYLEELPNSRDLSNWVLGLPSCVQAIGATPKAELVRLDPNANIGGIKWQPGNSFQKGVFSVTLDKKYVEGIIDVAAKGPDVARGVITGPSCSTF